MLDHNSDTLAMAAHGQQHNGRGGVCWREPVGYGCALGGSLCVYVPVVAGDGDNSGGGSACRIC